MDFIAPMLNAMFAILVTWIAIGFVGIGLGLAARFAVRSASSIGRNSVQLFWIGFCVAIAWTQIWHFVAPVNIACVATLTCVGITSHFVDRFATICGTLRLIVTRPAMTFCILATTIWLANRSTGPSDNIDTGLYHWNAIRWMTEYAIVPGLGNLHVRLGANQSALLYPALLDQGIWRGHSNHLANGLLLAMLFSQGWLGIDQVRRGSAIAGNWFDALLLTPAVLMTNHWWVSSHSTDVAPAMLAFAAVSNWLHSRETADPSCSHLVTLIFLGTAICLKITIAVFAIAFGLVVFFAISNARTKRIAIVAIAFLEIPWLIRGVLLSGYLLYPSTTIGFPVDWRLPVDIMQTENEHIRAFAKVHNDAFDPSKAHLWRSWKWLTIWFKLLEREIVIPALLTVIAAAIVISRRRAFGFEVRLVISAVIAIGFWFVTAPDTRFGFCLFWILLAALLPGMVESFRSPSPAIHRFALFACVALALGNIKKPYTEPSPTGFHPSAQADMAEYITNRQARVLIPKSGRLCFDAPLPCTPYPDPNLEQRDPHRLAAGYRIVR